MAILTAVAVRSCNKLIIVRIAVAVHANCEFDLVNGVFSCRNVALFALHLEVFASQRILRAVMLFHAEGRGLPAIDGMAFRAFSFLWTCVELPFVRIGRVAVLASSERNLLLEVFLDMARLARHLRMFS